MLYQGVKCKQTHVPVGIVRPVGAAKLVEVRHQLFVGDIIEHLGPGLKQRQVKIIAMADKDGELAKANPGNFIRMRTEPGLDNLQDNDLFRRRV